MSDVFGEEAGIHQGVSLDDLTANLQDGGCLLKLGSTIKSMRTLNSCSVKGGSSFKWQKKELNSTARCQNTMLWHLVQHQILSWWSGTSTWDRRVYRVVDWILQKAWSSSLTWKVRISLGEVWYTWRGQKAAFDLFIWGFMKEVINQWHLVYLRSEFEESR